MGTKLTTYLLQHRAYRWYRNFLYAIVYCIQCRERGRVAASLGTGPPAGDVGTLRLARVRLHDPAQWRRKGLSRSGVSSSEEASYHCFCCPGYCSRFHR